MQSLFDVRGSAAVQRAQRLPDASSGPSAELLADCFRRHLRRIKIDPGSALPHYSETALTKRRLLMLLAWVGPGGRDRQSRRTCQSLSEISSGCSGLRCGLRVVLSGALGAKFGPANVSGSRPNATAANVCFSDKSIAIPRSSLRLDGVAVMKLQSWDTLQPAVWRRLERIGDPDVAAQGVGGSMSRRSLNLVFRCTGLRCACCKACPETCALNAFAT